MYPSLNRTLVNGKKAEWREFADLAHFFGYPGVDVDLGAAMKEGAEQTKDLLAGKSLKPAVVGCPVNFREDDAKFSETMKGLPDAAKFAAAIGCPRMTTWVMPSFDVPKEEMWKLLRGRFGAIAKVLSDFNIRFGLEYIGPLHLRTRSPHILAYKLHDMLALAREAGPNVGVLLDSWHWHHAGDTLADIEKAGKDAIVHVQVADAPKLPPEEIRDNERLFAGEGVVDLKGFFATLRKIGYTDGVSPEIFGRGIKDMPLEEGVRLGYNSTAQTMRAAGVDW
ncbi:MAG: sugar phosphate isomerase/epimerase family protein [Bryobacterales bacterium]|nr:sugar phosphate isomerase/epimerase family protein [Bryobacterales bacterium]